MIMYQFTHYLLYRTMIHPIIVQKYDKTRTKIGKNKMKYPKNKDKITTGDSHRTHLLPTFHKIPYV